MFEKFKELFKSEDLLDDAFHTTLKMLEFDHDMYKASRETLRETDTAELPFDIKQTDRKINKFEREVRRNVLTHLTVAGVTDLVPGLVLVSIVIDVERIGDYTKNIYDLAKEHPKKLKGGKHENGLEELENVLGEIFPQTIQVLREQDKKLGSEIMRREDWYGKHSEAIVSACMHGDDPTLNVASAVGLALYARYLKRINAHLTNIASAIVNPFPRIGFREKRKKENS
ncbi:MAG: PhoU domain-containing protein [Candidatus Zixiibacteriota bacterium]|jgi:phosphate uptake regulator